MGKLARINAQRKLDGIPVDNGNYQKKKRFTREDQAKLTADLLNHTLGTATSGTSLSSGKRHSLGALLQFITKGF